MSAPRPTQPFSFAPRPTETPKATESKNQAAPQAPKVSEASESVPPKEVSKRRETLRMIGMDAAKPALKTTLPPRRTTYNVAEALGRRQEPERVIPRHSTDDIDPRVRQLPFFTFNQVKKQNPS